MSFSKEIINVLDYLCKKFGIVIDWTSKNVVPYIEDLCSRYIQYEIYTSIYWITIAIVALILFAIPVGILHKKASKIKWTFKSYEDLCMSAVILWVLFAFIALISVSIILTQVFDIVECYTLPEKVILEYLESLRLVKH